MPSKEEAKLLQKTAEAYTDACDAVAAYIFEHRTISKIKLHRALYSELKNEFKLKGQMAESAIRKVQIAYKTYYTTYKKWSPLYYSNDGFDVVKDRSYSFTKKDDIISIGTIKKRIKIPFARKNLDTYLNDGWEVGSGRVIRKSGKWFIYLSCKKEEPKIEDKDIKYVVGIDLGVNFIATTYDSDGKTRFFSGKEIKQRRARLKRIKTKLKRKGTPSATRRLEELQEKEALWISDINHKITKEIISAAKEPTLFVLERQISDRKQYIGYENEVIDVSWPFFDFKKKLEYKAKLAGHKVIYVDETNTSNRCPKCGYTNKTNRHKKEHSFECGVCYYESNDDRIAAMNLFEQGKHFLETGALGYNLSAEGEANRPIMRQEEVDPNIVKVAPLPPKVPQAPMPK